MVPEAEGLVEGDVKGDAVAVDFAERCERGDGSKYSVVLPEVEVRIVTLPGERASPHLPLG